MNSAARRLRRVAQLKHAVYVGGFILACVLAAIIFVGSLWLTTCYLLGA